MFITSVEHYGVGQELLLVTQTPMDDHKFCSPLLAVYSYCHMTAAWAWGRKIAARGIAETGAPLHPVQQISNGVYLPPVPSSYGGLNVTRAAEAR